MSIEREELINYCLRRLGAPVIQINIAPSQMEDCVDDTIALYDEAHGDGHVRTVLKHVITQNDITNKYIEVPSYVTSIIQMLPLNSTIMGGSGWNSLISPQYQYMASEVFSLSDARLISYELAMQNLRLYESYFADLPRLSFSHKQGRVMLEMDWNRFKVDDVVIFECYIHLDPEEVKKIYSDRWVRKYCCALMKRQWGANLKKFQGVALSGGITLDGQTIFSEGDEEVKALEQELFDRYEPPLDFFVG